MTVKYILTDSGRVDDGYAHEEEDCTVRALSNATDLTYREAHDVLKLAGRRDGERTPRTITNTLYEKILGFPCTIKATTVEKEVELRPTGRYIFRIIGHVFAVVNGVIYDNCKASEYQKEPVSHIWEVEK